MPTTIGGDVPLERRSGAGRDEVRTPERILRYPFGMMRIVLAISLLLTAVVAGAENLVVGSKAPPFSLAGSDGRTHTLAEHAGKRGVVLAWFPKAFTPG